MSALSLSYVLILGTGFIPILGMFTIELRLCYSMYSGSTSILCYLLDPSVPFSCYSPKCTFRKLVVILGVVHRIRVNIMIFTN